MKRLLTYIFIALLVGLSPGVASAFDVYGGGANIWQGTQTIDADGTECFLVRQDGDAGDVFTVNCDSEVVLVPDGATGDPGLAFQGYPTTGIYAASANFIRFVFSGTDAWDITSSRFGKNVSLYPILINEETSAINPNVIPNSQDVGTGVGSASVGSLTLIANSAEGPSVVEDSGISSLYLPESTEPTAVTNYGALWASAANTLNFIDGAGVNHVLGGTDHAEMYDEDNTDAFVINASGEMHAYHTNGLTYLHLEDTWTFDGGGAGSSIAISSVADGGSGEIAVTTGAVHGLSVGDVISHSNLSDAAYRGIFVVNTVTSTTIYEVTAVYTATDTGYMDQAATLTANAGAAGEYQVVWNASATSAGSNETFDFELCNNGVTITGTKARRKFGTGGDFGVMSGSSLVTITVGDKISFALTNTSSGGDMTIRNFMFYLLKI